MKSRETCDAENDPDPRGSAEPVVDQADDREPPDDLFPGGTECKKGQGDASGPRASDRRGLAVRAPKSERRQDAEQQSAQGSERENLTGREEAESEERECARCCADEGEEVVHVLRADASSNPRGSSDDVGERWSCEMQADARGGGDRRSYDWSHVPIT